MCQDGTPTAQKKTPKQWFIPLFGPQYVYYECHITMMATNGHHGQWTGGLEQVSSPPCMFFFSFFFLTNMNFELNRLCHSHLTPLPTTPQRCQRKTAPCSQKKCPNNGSYRHLGLDVHATSPHGQQTGARDLSWAPHVCFSSFFLC